MRLVVAGQDVGMESIDRQILALLGADGRMSFTEIGKQTGMSTSAAQQRVRRLEERGVLVGYRAVIDAQQVERGLTAFISVQPVDPVRDDQVVGVLSGFPEITSCYSVAGDASYLVEVQIADPAALDDLLTRIRTAAQVSTVTTVVLTTVFSGRPLIEGP